MPTEKEILRINGHEVTVTNPRKVYFPATGHTKLDLVQYYLAVADGALRGAGGRPMALKRFVDGIAGQAFFQKRAPENIPEFIRTATLTFPSGRTADEIVIDDAAGLAWVANLGCIDLNPHPVRAEDLDHPDELRVDLDPVPGVEWPQIRLVALAARDALADVGLVGWPKTSGSRGIHINVRIEPRWTFPEVRRAALALARDVERRVPDLATSKWWKEERHGVFLDYNQNAKDRTVASAYSVRPLPDARVSTPLTWDEVPTVEAEAFTIDTVPARYASIGDPGDGIDAAVGSLDALLELSRRHEAEGLGDAPWPPNYAKQAGEPPRVQPSRARRAPAEYEPGRGEAGGPPPEVAQARAAAVASGDPNAGLPTEWAGSRPTPTGRRRTSIPVVEIARAEHRDEALAGLERWKARHRAVVPYLEPADILVDGMRGRSSLWYRVRVNLIHVPEGERPAQEPLESDFDPWAGMDIDAWKAATAGSRARRPGSGRTSPGGAASAAPSGNAEGEATPPQPTPGSKSATEAEATAAAASSSTPKPKPKPKPKPNPKPRPGPESATEAEKPAAAAASSSTPKPKPKPKPATGAKPDPAAATAEALSKPRRSKSGAVEPAASSKARGSEPAPKPKASTRSAPKSPPPSAKEGQGS